ncbi:membrane protein insertase YidC [Flavobacteriaceae bacterium]|nr:membrane protein insertase YidC [Flavobacteriaceae bacterium]
MEEKKFDKNSIIGFLLIGAIMLYYLYTNQPEVSPVDEVTKTEEVVTTDQAAEFDAEQALNPTTYPLEVNSQKEAFTKVTTKKYELTFSNKGGYIKELRLLEYDTYKGDPVYIIKDGNAGLNIEFSTIDGRTLDTENLFFSPSVNKSGETTFVKMRFALSANQFLEYTYSIKADDYMMDFSVQSQGLATVVNGSKGINLSLDLIGFRQEKSISYENQQSALYYQVKGSEVEDLSIGSDDEENDEDIDWVGFKQHFFSSILINKTGFASGEFKSKSLFEDEEVDSLYTKSFAFTAPLTLNAGEFDENFNYYIGPNDYDLLKSYDEGIENIIDLGWGIFGTINRWAFIPLFSFLSEHMTNFGLIIILMTIIVRIFMSPLVYKSYVSSAKMKILRPEMNEINKKFPGQENAMKRQQETMAIQKKAGVSMLSGCIPALLQMPVFFALFRFFPSAIGLRGEGFLWANDLSSYDSIYQLPITIPFYGDHISLFPILASVAIFFYMKMNQSQQMNMQQPAQEGMPDMQAMMKYMIYLSPVMMLFFFNNYASGLSLYYFVSNLLTITIMLVIKNVIINEDKLHAEIEENKKKPVKTSKFRKRLDDAMKQAQDQQSKQKKK